MPYVPNEYKRGLSLPEDVREDLDMWYPNVSNETWLNLHPQLRSELPIRCICGKVAENIKPVVTDSWSGFASTLCSCGSPFSSVTVPRNSKLNKKLIELLKEF